MRNKLTYATLPLEVKTLAAKNLGIGVLEALLSQDHEYFLIMQVSHGIFIGFAIYHFTEKDNDGNWTNGIIDIVCIDFLYRGEGHGTALTFAVLKKMAANKIRRIEILLKMLSVQDRDSEIGISYAGSDKMLKNLGFKQVHTFHNYFEDLSETLNYECAFCGSIPDLCIAVLYAINEP